MDTPGYIVLSRLVAAQRMAAVTANNVANADTPGFRPQRPLFGAVLERQQALAAGWSAPWEAPPAGPAARDVAFARDRATWQEAGPAPLIRTGNPLDLALADPDAFFAVETPRGERLTRAGRFTLDGEGRVTDAAGHAVLGSDGRPLRIEPGAARIEVRGDGSVQTEAGVAGQLRLLRVAPADRQRLQAEGDRLFAPPDDLRPAPAERPGVVQGAVEGSGVQPVRELTRLTEELRQFQMVAQMAEREGERLSSAVERILRRR